MSDDKDSNKSIDRRRSARSTDIARRIVEEIEAKRLKKQKDERADDNDPEKEVTDK